jgi:hypothetical protein
LFLRHQAREEIIKNKLDSRIIYLEDELGTSLVVDGAWVVVSLDVVSGA